MPSGRVSLTLRYPGGHGLHGCEGSWLSWSSSSASVGFGGGDHHTTCVSPLLEKTNADADESCSAIFPSFGFFLSGADSGLLSSAHRRPGQARAAGPSTRSIDVNSSHSERTGGPGDSRMSKSS